jgi:hypothetical protein
VLDDESIIVLNHFQIRLTATNQTEKIMHNTSIKGPVTTAVLPKAHITAMTKALRAAGMAVTITGKGDTYSADFKDSRVFMALKSPAGYMVRHAANLFA